jgi:hypothetical protein
VISAEMKYAFIREASVHATLHFYSDGYNHYSKQRTKTFQLVSSHSKQVEFIASYFNVMK